MGVVTHQVLQPDMGVRLPTDVRRALIEMGNACNGAAVHLHQAQSDSMRIESVMEAQRATGPAGQLARQVADDLQRLADQHFEQAIVVLARAATIYAGYASQVAAAVAKGEPPPTPGSLAIRPSDMITACGLYLPEVRFTDDGQAREVQEQNVAIAEIRRALTELITHRMRDETASAYDEIAVPITDSSSEHRLVEFAAALHGYASVLVWALSLFSGTARDGAGSREQR